MRSTIIAAAALAATVIAVPLQERAVVYATDVEMVYVTDYVTVTADGPAPTDDAVAPHNNYHYGHGPNWWNGPSKHHTKEPPHAPPPSQPSPAPEPSPSPEPEPAPQPKPTTATGGWGSAPTSSPPSTGGSAPSDYQGKVLWHHNIHRKNHSSPDIVWSASLASTAQKIADSCSYGHNTAMDGGGYGQNIAAGVDPSGIDRVITNMFYDSEVNAYEAASNDYTNSSPSNFETWGHMSQVVWANTREVACVTKDCSGQGLANTGGNVPAYFTVCNYGPPGNVAGNYGENVHKSLKMASVVV